MRVLLDDCLDKLDIEFKFIIATDEDLSKKKVDVMKYFVKMLEFIPKKQRNRFVLEIWDKKELLNQEKILGLKIDL